MTHYNVLIIGAGTAGIMVAAQLKRKGVKSIGLIDPADTHYYQPAWTLVGAGSYDYKKTARPMKSVIPSGVDWIQDFVEQLNPKDNQVSTKGENTYSYDYLVVAPGLLADLSLVDGLNDALATVIVCSNYRILE